MYQNSEAERAAAINQCYLKSTVKQHDFTPHRAVARVIANWFFWLSVILVAVWIGMVSLHTQSLMPALLVAACVIVHWAAVRLAREPA